MVADSDTAADADSADFADAADVADADVAEADAAAAAGVHDEQSLPEAACLPRQTPTRTPSLTFSAQFLQRVGLYIDADPSRRYTIQLGDKGEGRRQRAISKSRLNTLPISNCRCSFDRCNVEGKRHCPSVSQAIDPTPTLRTTTWAGFGLVGFEDSKVVHLEARVAQ